MSRRARLLILLAVAASFATTAAYGYLTATSTRGATDPSAAARSRPAGAAPRAAATGTTVTVSIPQLAVAGQGLGTYAGGGYLVRRYAASATVDGTGATPAATCASVVSGSGATLTCEDTGVPSGSWKYTATPALNLWRGAESAAGAAVTVASGDTTAPQLVSLEMRDANANGRVDEVRATFGETLASSTATAPWTLANVPSGGTLASVQTSGAVATLTLTEGSGAASTAVGGFTVALAASATGIRDAAGNQSSFAATAPADRAAPARTALEMHDTAAVIGKVDQVRATFSEPIVTSGVTTAPWTLANVPSGGTLSGVSASGSTATLSLTEGAGAADTAVGSFTVALAASAAGVRDAAGNQGAFAATAPADKAGPVPTAVASAQAGPTPPSVVGKFETGDTMTITFSEALPALGIATSDVALTGGSGNGAPDLVSMSGLLAGQIALGRADYVADAGNGLTASFLASPLTKPAANQIRVTLSVCAGTGCLHVRQAGTNGNWNFFVAPAATLADLAGNAATGVFNHRSVVVF